MERFLTVENDHMSDGILPDDIFGAFPESVIKQDMSCDSVQLFSTEANII
jgi:hypothetical protein